MDSNSNTTTIDHIDQITVPGDVFREPANEYWALICLQHGMEFLYRQVSCCDQAVKQQVNPDNDAKFFASGNFPAFDCVPQTLITCAFHWYAISACQYVKTVGAIAYKLDSNRRMPHEYAMRIIPQVVAFRDKVAAHFAWTTENRRDNDAERLASILPPLTFENNSFHVGGWTVLLHSGEKSSQSDTIKPWSLCRVHEELRKRYWPNRETSSDVITEGSSG